tara:strand:- start:107 stop:502 length:396 start_codon:yes stop_codon:yes gene_type:complete
MINILDLLGRVFISILFLVNGYLKISNYEGTLEWMESYNVPGILLTPAIILEIAAPILIIIGYKTKIAAFLLSAFCLVTALIFHTDFSSQSQITSFLKNIALAGGFLFIVVNGAKKYSFDNIKKNGTSRSR